jgi:hypothetical protein
MSNSYISHIWSRKSGALQKHHSVSPPICDKTPSCKFVFDYIILCRHFSDWTYANVFPAMAPFPCYCRGFQRASRKCLLTGQFFVWTKRGRTRHLLTSQFHPLNSLLFRQGSCDTTGALYRTREVQGLSHSPERDYSQFIEDFLSSSRIQQRCYLPWNMPWLLSSKSFLIHNYSFIPRCIN